MNRKQKTLLTLAAGALATFSYTPAIQAQSSDALIDKLISKGILTQEEAKDLRKQSNEDFNKAYATKSGMPDWVTSLKLNGDVRARYENFDNADLADRSRLRYRLRFGVVATFKDNLEAGFRLSSDEPASNNTMGGDPTGANTTFQNNGSKKFVYLDLAYGKWTMLNSPDFASVWTIGKMENPFVFSESVFDPDYTPEGIAQQFTYHATADHDLKLNLGAFVLDENSSFDYSGQNNDPWLFGAQARWDANWSKKIQTSAGLGIVSIMEEEDLPTGAVPNQNAGNERVGGNLVNEFNTVVADASVTYKLDKAPLYKGTFPIKVGGEVLHNLEADGKNLGWMAGIVFGKAGKKGTWEMSYRYKVLEANSWYEELTDSDFGAFSGASARYGYDTFSANSPTANYFPGTNLRGHVIKASYSPFNAITLTATYTLTELIEEPSPLFSDETGRFQLDAVWKF